MFAFFIAYAPWRILFTCGVEGERSEATTTSSDLRPEHVPEPISEEDYRSDVITELCNSYRRGLGIVGATFGLWSNCISFHSFIIILPRLVFLFGYLFFLYCLAPRISLRCQFIFIYSFCQVIGFLSIFHQVPKFSLAFYLTISPTSTTVLYFSLYALLH